MKVLFWNCGSGAKDVNPKYESAETVIAKADAEHIDLLVLQEACLQPEWNKNTSDYVQHTYDNYQVYGGWRDRQNELRPSDQILLVQKNLTHYVHTSVFKQTRRVMQIVECTVAGKKLIIGALHGASGLGKSEPQDKERDRIQKEQNDFIVTKLKAHSADYVLFGGDLNYSIFTPALADLAEREVFGTEGGTNLNHVFGISDSRTDAYPAYKKVRQADWFIASDGLARYVTDITTHRKVQADHAVFIVTLEL